VPALPGACVRANERHFLVTSIRTQPPCYVPCSAYSRKLPVLILFELQQSAVSATSSSSRVLTVHCSFLVCLSGDNVPLFLEQGSSANCAILWLAGLVFASRVNNWLRPGCRPQGRPLPQQHSSTATAGAHDCSRELQTNDNVGTSEAPNRCDKLDRFLR
jgi:hypothetical protein